MEFENIKIYGKKTLSDLLKEVHEAQKSKEAELKELILELRPMIQTKGDAVVLVPLITKYVEASIKNDGNLITMVGIIQRAISTGRQSENGDVNLSDEEKEQLLKNAKELKVV